MVGKFQMDFPAVGPFSMTFNQIVAPGFFKREEKTEAERFYARWMMNEETGEIMIDGTEKILMYDKDKEKYWLQSPEDYFLEPDTSRENNNKTFSFSFISDDEGESVPPKCTRTGGENIEYLYGFKTKKWITTISISEKRMVFEEWFVDTLPLKILSDSLEFEIKRKFNPNKEIIKSDEFEFSSNLFINGLDTLTSLEPIPGQAVKINFLIFEDDKDPSMTASFEILELYAEPVDTGYFVIPEHYEKTDRD